MRQLIFILLFGLSIHSIAQVEISYSSNSPRECDSIVSQLTEYIPAGSGGEDAVWDFSTTSAHQIQERFIIHQTPQEI